MSSYKADNKNSILMIYLYIISCAIAFVSKIGYTTPNPNIKYSIFIFWIIIALFKFSKSRFCITSINLTLRRLFLLFLIPRVFIHIYSIILYLMGVTDYVTRNTQTYLVVFAVFSAIYIFGKNVIWYTIGAALLSYSGVIIYDMWVYGIDTIPKTMISLINGEYFEIAALYEVNDYSFAIGYLIIFYFFIKEKFTKKDLIFSFCLIIFMFLGLKRIQLLAIILLYFYILISKFVVNKFRFYKFTQQIALINELIKNFPEKSAQRIFLAISPDFLKLSFHTASEIPNEKSFLVMQNFPTFKTPEYVKFRENIWQGLISLANQKTNHKTIKHLIADYSRDLRLTIINNSNSVHSVHDVIENDKRYLVKIIPIVFHSSSLTDCEAVANIVESLNKLNIGMPNLKEFSENSIFKIYQKLSIQIRSKDFDESKFIREFPDKLGLLRQLVDLLEKIDNGIIAYEISDILQSLIKDIEDNHLDLLGAAEIIFKSKKTVEYVNIQVFNYLFKEFELKQIINLIQDSNVDHQDLLWYYFFSNIPYDKVDEETFELLKRWLNNETEEDVGNTINRNILFAQKFNRVNKQALEECCSIVWSKGEKFRIIYFRYVSLDEKQSSVLVKSFQNITLLEDIYLFILKRNSQNGDYSGYLFKDLYKEDTNVLIRYIDDILIPQLKNTYSVKNKYELVNLMAGQYGQTVLCTIWNHIYQTRQTVLQIAYLRFLINQLCSVQGEASTQINKWLTTLIQQNNDNTAKVQMIFDGLNECDDLSIYHKYIKVLILTKPDPDFFSKIRLDKSSLSWDVSEAGIKEVFGGEINQLQQLSTWTSTLGVDYFEYKKIIDQRIEVIQKELKDLLDRLDAGID